MKTMKALALTLLLVLTAVPLVGAQTGVWDSSFQVINLGGETASVSVVFYEDDGTAHDVACLRYVGTDCDLPNPFSLDAGAKEEIFLGAIGDDLPDDRYSVVISADQPIASVGSLVGNDAGNFYNGSYTGLEDDGQMEMYLPGSMWGYYSWNSHISAQNLTGDDLDLTVNFYLEGSTTVCATEGPETVPAYSSWHLDTETLDLSACDFNGDGFNGAAVVSAAGAIAAIDNQTTGGGSYFEQSYTGFLEGADTLYAPSFFRGAFPPGNWNTSLNIMNIGAAASHVVVTVNTPDGAVTIEDDLDPYQGWLIYPPVDMPTLPIYAWNEMSALIEGDAGAELVAIANSANSLMQAQTYNALTVDEGGATVAVPIVSRNYYGWDTSMAIQNLGPDALVAHVSYSANANPYGTVWAGAEYDTASIASGQALAIFQGNGDDALFAATGERIPETYTGGAIVTITSGTGPIAAVINTTNGPGQVDNDPGPGDWSTSLNAISQ
ncbi:MAG: hypothetical protein JXA37_04940 [Chloroflexia bacterium]|nr:hypothetical protein [Chloroflexia bacterium]